MGARRIDIAILGGGLAGSLIALALHHRRPELRLALIEREDHCGGRHVWSFFASDVLPEHAWLIDPLVASRWDGYDVRFPGHARTLTTPYRSVTSETLDAAVRSALPPEALLTGTGVREAGQAHVVLDSGERIAAGGVIDARGAAGLAHMAGGWQKFCGQLLTLQAPHGLARPIVMDARVDQLDGYRFVYCLPFSATQIFIEDTYYSDSPHLAVPALRGRIDDYAAAQGWRVDRVESEETGVLPVIARGNFDAFWPKRDSLPGGAPARAGARAGLMHPLTSYSLPDAVRFAARIATLPDLSGAALAHESREWAQAHWQMRGFYRLLSRMMFAAGAPQRRFRMLERFYRLPEPLIERFYAGRSTLADRVRVFAGKPPVPLGGAIATLVGGGRPLAPLTAPQEELA